MSSTENVNWAGLNRSLEQRGKFCTMIHSLQWLQILANAWFGIGKLGSFFAMSFELGICWCAFIVCDFFDEMGVVMILWSYSMFASKFIRCSFAMLYLYCSLPYEYFGWTTFYMQISERAKCHFWKPKNNNNVNWVERECKTKRRKLLNTRSWQHKWEKDKSLASGVLYSWDDRDRRICFSSSTCSSLIKSRQISSNLLIW